MRSTRPRAASAASDAAMPAALDDTPADSLAEAQRRLLTLSPDLQSAISLDGQTAPADVADLLRASAARLAPPLRGGRVYTDDKAPVEWLIDKSILDYAQDADPEAGAG